MHLIYAATTTATPPIESSSVKADTQLRRQLSTTTRATTMKLQMTSAVNNSSPVSMESNDNMNQQRTKHKSQISLSSSSSSSWHNRRLNNSNNCRNHSVSIEDKLIITPSTTAVIPIKSMRYLNAVTRKKSTPRYCNLALLFIVSVIAILNISEIARAASVVDTHLPPLSPAWHEQQQQLLARQGLAGNNNVTPHNYLLSVWLNSISSGKNQIDSDLAERLHEGRTHDHSTDRIDLDQATRAWRLMRSNIHEYATQQVHQMRPIIGQLMVAANVSSECRQSIEHVLGALTSMKLWAFKLWNSWGDFPSTGLIEGSFTSMGSYYGCVDLTDDSNPPQSGVQLRHTIGQAQYCRISYQPLVPQRPRYHNILSHIPGLANFTSNDEILYQLAMKAQYFYYAKLRTAICMPSKCSLEDITSMATLVGANAMLQNTEVKCLKRESVTINSHQYVAIVVLGTLAAFALLGTLLHITGIEQWGQQWAWTPAPVVRFLGAMMHFSVVRNIRRLFDTSNSSQDITCVHGLRFWTITWIIFGHTMQYTEWAGFARAFLVEQNLVAFALQPFLNATFSVDTFFLISGALTTYVTWSMTKGDPRRFNKFAFILSRYLRLTPQVMLITLAFFILPLLGDGPHWKGLIDQASENCQRNWWVNALYLQAFVKSDQICNLVTWWLSIEMFYHVISVIAIVVLLKSKAKGMLVTLAMGTGFTLVSFYLHYINNYPPNMLPTLPQRYEIWDSIVRNGWLAFTVIYLTILFGTYQWNNASPYTRLGAAVYYNTSQVMWALATAWAILACVIGRGGFVNRFLSSPIWIPLGRATYMTYLAHMMVVMSFPATMNQLIEPSYHMFLYIFVSNLVLSYLLGITLTVVYESPLLHLQKLALTALLLRTEPKSSDEKDATKTAALIAASPVASQSLVVCDPQQQSLLSSAPAQQSPLLNNDVVIVNSQLKANLALNMGLERDVQRFKGARGTTRDEPIQ
ncbi:Nose resistant to fluoxetine protein 6, partial [Fragariocoptes setiger]